VPLVKFAALQAGVGECWLDLLKVSSIWPLLGAPFVPEGESIDLGTVVEIGCRACCEGKLFDLTVLPNELAAQVATARELEILDRRWSAAGTVPLH